MLSQHVIFPFIYFINRWRRIDEYVVIFADAHHDTCPPQMDALKKRLIEEHYDVRECFQNLAQCSTFAGMCYMINFMKLYAMAGTVVICDNYLPVASCRKRKETRVIQLWHGCGAFKKFGCDATDDIPEMYRGNVYKNYSLVTVSGEHCIPYFESAMRINQNNDSKEADHAYRNANAENIDILQNKENSENNVVRATGISYTDRFYDKAYIDTCRDRFRYEYPDAVGKKVILWAPTFRGNAGVIIEESLKQMGEEYVDSLSENEDVYVIKSLHPHFMKGKKVSMTTGELLVCADVLITDYSSVFFEYLIMDRPIIFFASDYDKYSEERGYYLDYTGLPGVIVTDGDSLAQTVRTVIDCDTQDMHKKREIFRERYMSACDGNATERIISYIKSSSGIEK